MALPVLRRQNDHQLDRPLGGFLDPWPRLYELMDRVFTPLADLEETPTAH